MALFNFKYWGEYYLHVYIYGYMYISGLNWLKAVC